MNIYGDPNSWANTQPNWNMPQAQQPNWVPQLKTNKILVTSLEEALSKPAERYSEMYYWDQSKPVIYVVRTDQNMVKSWAEIPYTLPNQASSIPATKAELDALAAELAELKAKLESKKPKQKVVQEVISDAESLG